MKPVARSLALPSFTALLLCLSGGLGLNLVMAPAATACDGVAIAKPKQPQNFAFDNGLKLGLTETAIVETLGQPQQRLMVQTNSRCGSVLEQFSYENEATLIFVDRPLPGKPVKSIRRFSQTAKRLSSDAKLLSADAKPEERIAIKPGERAITRILTRSPQLTLSGTIRVGDSRQQLLTQYGEPQTQSSHHIQYSKDNQQLNFTLDRDKITAIELIQGDSQIANILAKHR